MKKNAANNRNALKCINLLSAGNDKENRRNKKNDGFCLLFASSIAR